MKGHKMSKVDALLAETDALIKEGQELLATGPVLQIVKTDVVKMEYFRLASIRLSYRFLYRFVEPVATVWEEGEITAYGVLSQGLDGTKEKDFNILMKDYALETWRNLVLANCPEKDLPDDALWLLDMKGSEVYECNVIRK